MKPERWRKIESIFHKALEAEESRGAAVLEESCAGHEDLRREVESLLAHHSESASFIETPGGWPTLRSQDAATTEGALILAFLCKGGNLGLIPLEFEFGN
jgi:hypothetical protein